MSKICEGIEFQERHMPYPVTSFPWADFDSPKKWAPEMEALKDEIRERGRTSIRIIMPGSTLGGDHSMHYTALLAALDWVTENSVPCDTHILAGRICDVLEAALPGKDDFHSECMARFQELQHIVFRRERLE